MNTRAFTALLSVSVTSAFTSVSVRPQFLLPSRALALTARANSRGTSAARQLLTTSSFPPAPAFPRCAPEENQPSASESRSANAWMDQHEDSP